MTVGELRRLLNTLPRTSDHDIVVFMDDDASVAFEVASVEHREAEQAVWLHGAEL
ncbi:hypothetical protein [Streptomyces sp. NPDC020141]|uniref:hypothetical protein n=1 Tax=Streptomyces sp. NPDC020141 TaxID=3365065 RepID=UPI00379738E6